MKNKRLTASMNVSRYLSCFFDGLQSRFDYDEHRICDGETDPRKESREEIIKDFLIEVGDRSAWRGEETVRERDLGKRIAPLVADLVKALFA